MLNDFADGVLVNPVAKGIVDPIARLAEDCRQRDGWLIIYAHDAHQPGDSNFRSLGEHALAGSSGAEVIAGL